MTDPASSTRRTGVEAANIAYIEGQIEQIRYIYDILFPDQALELHLWWETSDVRTPAVCEQNDRYGADLFGPTYIGQYALGPEGTAVKQIHLTIPSRMQTYASTDKAVSWSARPRYFKAAHRYAPLLAEDLKYLIERRRRTRQLTRHRFERIPFEAGMLSPSTARHSAAKNPAALIGFHWMSYGGAEKLAFDTVDWALEQGLRVFAIPDIRGPQPLIDKLPDDPRVTVLRTDYYVPREYIPSFLVALAVRENIVVTHNHHCVALYDALPAMRVRCPDVMHLDSVHIIEHADGGYPRISGVWSNFIDHHHVISADLKEFYRKNFRVNGKVVVGRLLDDSQRERIPDPVRLKAGQRSARIAFVGRMMHQKRPMLVAEICNCLARWGKTSGIAFEFDLVGEGPYRTAVEVLIKVYGLGDRTRFHNAGTDVSALLRKSDVLVLPSANEGLALVCYEAIEHGCIPISTDVGAQSEIMPADLMVPLLPRHTVRDTVALIKRLLKEDGYAQALEQQLHDRFGALAVEPSAKEVIGALYKKAKTLAQTRAADKDAE